MEPSNQIMSGKAPSRKSKPKGKQGGFRSFYRRGWVKTTTTTTWAPPPPPPTTTQAPPPPPPIDCEMGEWSEWGACECDNKEDKCGACKRTRHNKVVKQAENGGKDDCKEEEEEDDCSKPCPIDCEMGNWSQWGKCVYSKGDCGEGKETRTKDVKSQGQHGGDTSCKKQVEDKECDKPCPIDCTMGQWTAWGKCSYSNEADQCGSGQRIRTKKEEVKCAHGGDCSCKAEDEEESCDKPCPTTTKGWQPAPAPPPTTTPAPPPVRTTTSRWGGHRG